MALPAAQRFHALRQASHACRPAGALSIPGVRDPRAGESVRAPA